MVEPMGHTVYNYGMYSAGDDVSLTYVQAGILAAILLNSGAADYVVTGCGTGEGAMLACNSFPGVICGHVEDPVDAYTFAQVNDGNCVAMPFAKGCGWGMELNWEYVFEKLFGFGSGNGKTGISLKRGIHKQFTATAVQFALLWLFLYFSCCVII